MDPVLEALGWFGHYQRKQFALLMLQAVDCAFNIMSFIFVGRYFEHTCAETDLNNTRYNGIFTPFKESSHPFIDNAIEHGLNVTYSSCSLHIKNGSHDIYSHQCENGYNYDQPKDRSFIAEWDLVCEKDALAETTQTVMFVGMMFGASLFPAISDKYGRKPVYVASHVCLFSLAVAQAFAPDYMSYLAMKFLFGSVQQGTGLVSCIMLLELLPTSRRAVVSKVGTFLWPSCLMLLGCVCFLCRYLTWRHTQLVLAVFSSYAIIQWWTVEESIRWLSANGRTDEAEKILKKASKANGVDPKTILKLHRQENGQLNQILLVPQKPLLQDSIGHMEELSSRSLNLEPSKFQPYKDEEEMQYSAFWKHKQIFIITAVTCFMWLTDGMAYYGLLITSSSFHDDVYIGFELNVLVEIPAGFAMLFLIDTAGRKFLLLFSHSLAGLSLLAAVILSNVPALAGIPGMSTIILIVSLLGKFGITLGFAVIWLYTPEIFPTNIRSTAFGIGSVAGRIGGMVAPYSRTVGRHLPWLPGTVFAILCLCIPVLLRFLPETKGRELPQTIAEMRFGSSSRTSEESESHNRTKS